MFLLLFRAGTFIGDVISVRSESALHTGMELPEFHGKNQPYSFYGDSALELKSAASNDMLLHLTITPN